MTPKERELRLNKQIEELNAKVDRILELLEKRSGKKVKKDTN